uniref:Xaa-Pro dipeptidyl-peptidase-like domain-containing protein n=1 Tax=Aureoumbra lagunensis TaxID=44058 RepID=A0A7S3NDZ9_9STRA|mmetsp:Transcript_20825/g.31879  ORF Transcript_20825/g.31879 Transcript_20825/m.31879 type:complete len:1302 (+) Transcript_20825:83-3988(+)
MWGYFTNYMPDANQNLEEESNTNENEEGRRKRIIILEDGSIPTQKEDQVIKDDEKAVRNSERNADKLAALHAKFRADLDAAPLDELKEAARSASHANVAPEAAGGWKITAALAMMRRGIGQESEEGDKTPTGGWAPFLLPKDKKNQEEDVVEFSVGTDDVPDIYMNEDKDQLASGQEGENKEKVLTNDEPALLSAPRSPEEFITSDEQFGTPTPLSVPKEWISTSPPTSDSLTSTESSNKGPYDKWGVSIIFEDKVKLSSRWSVARMAEGTPEGIFEAGVATTLESVGFADGSWLRLRIKRSAVALDLLRATAARIGVEQRDAGALALYELRGPRLSRLVSPGEPLPRGFKFVLALRLLTGPIHAAALRGCKIGATRGEAAIARLLYAQTVAAIMSGAFAVLPNLGQKSKQEQDIDTIDSDCAVPWRDVSLAESVAALPARVRFGALRLLSRARDAMFLLNGGTPSSTSTTSAIARRLLGEHGVAAFAPHPTPSFEEIMRDLDALLSSQNYTDVSDDEINLEIEEGQGASALSSHNGAETPEAAYLELAALSPAYGCTLFPCSSAIRIEDDSDTNDHSMLSSPRGTPNRITRWLAISRRGASILSSDTSVRLHDIPLECARRWRLSKDGIILEYERPFNRWPSAARRRSSLEEQRQAARKQLEKRSSYSGSKSRRNASDESFVSSLASYFAQGNDANGFDDDGEESEMDLMEQLLPRIETDEYGEVSCRDPKHAPMFRVKFQLIIPPDAGAPGGATEAVALLDDYCLCDLAESPPDFGWEEASLEAQTAAANDPTSKSADITCSPRKVNAKPKTMPGFYDALVSAVVRPPRFKYDPRLLGPSSFRFGGKRFHRRDIVLCNRRNERIHLSWWYQLPDEDDDDEYDKEQDLNTECSKDQAIPKQSSTKKRRMTTRRDKRTQMSTVCTETDNEVTKKTPAIVFVHANSASRAQSCHYLSLVLSLGCSLVAFDCAGSGMSDGSLVTLGWREAHDLRVVLDWVRSQPTVSSVAVWGQSMGAASAIYYQGLAALHCAGGLDDDFDDEPLLAGGSIANSSSRVSFDRNDSRGTNHRQKSSPQSGVVSFLGSGGNSTPRTSLIEEDTEQIDLRKIKTQHNMEDQPATYDKPWPKIDAVVLDSPYSDFQKLATHIANERRAFFGGFTLPTVVLDLLLSSLDASVLNKAGFSPLTKLSPIAHASRCSSPALFVRARKDPLITQDHVESLAKKYGGPRTLALVEGTHSSPRDVDARKFIGRFLERQLPLPPKHQRLSKRAVERHLVCAPWQRTRTPAALEPKPQKQSSSSIK